MVVCRNEETHLRRCLASLAFCDERVVVDMDSDDGSRRVAREAGARVVPTVPSPIVERVRARALAHARHEWVVILDPDEVVPPAMARALQAAIASHPDAWAIRVPRRYHLKGRRIEHGFWSGPHMAKTIAVHRGRARPVPMIHGGWRHAQPDASASHSAEAAGAGASGMVVLSEAGELVHHWADSYGQLIAKHRRYLPFEAQARAQRGDRFGWGAMLSDLARTLSTDVRVHRGLAGGPRGWFLLLFHVACVGGCWLALRRRERTASLVLARAR